ncbi:MAG: SAM-dependent methyltransferase [Chloroflexi bacterium]|nr:SAM-dependent methyltransferase [Chloroflexota bacterium]
MSSDYNELLREHILDDDRFIRAIFSGRQRGAEVPWQKVTLRPVMVRGKKHLQLVYFDGRQDVIQNYQGEDAGLELGKLLATPFQNFHVQTSEGDIQVRITKKGKVRIHRTVEERNLPDLSHDRRKQLPFPADKPDPFLHAIGIMTADGRVKSSMQGKFHQINEFIRLVEESGGLADFDEAYVVDCGCGNAYLTFAMHYYLKQQLEMNVRTTGVDVRGDLINNHALLTDTLQWPNIDFATSAIIDFQPDTSPDIVLALHACDTATDEALAQAVQWGSHLIVSAPCCHHHLQVQLQQRSVTPFEPILRHGILKERLGDVLTDALRAAILRVMGYQTQVIEFVSSEHTAKNVMIRAVNTAQPGEQRFVQEYLQLRDFWGVRPYLEELLGDPLAIILRQPPA